MDPARDGLNWYVYVYNNPLKYIDPTGMEGEFVWWNPFTWFSNRKETIDAVSGAAPSVPRDHSFNVQFQEDVFRGSASVTFGYTESMHRLQGESKSGNLSGFVGKYGKASGLNITGLIGIGNDDVSVSLKGVGDVMTATAQAGVQYKDGLGVALRAKASVVSGRATVHWDIFGTEIEFGVTGDALSIGGELSIGSFPDRGFEVRLNGALGVGGGFILRVKPLQ